MNGVTLSDLMIRLTSRLSEGDTEFFTDANKIAWLNEAQDVICAHVPFTAETTWNLDTVPGSSSYLLDPDCLQPTGAMIRLSGGQLVRLNFLEADTMDGAKSWINSSAPQSYLKLIVSGHKRPVQLSETTDRTEIPASVATAIVDYALGKAKQKDEEMPQAQFASAEFGAHLMDLQASRMVLEYDQFNRARAYRGVRGPGFRPWRPYSCTYRHALEGTFIELYGVGV